MSELPTALYTKAPDDTVWGSDWNQLTNALSGASDPGPIAFAGPTSSPATAPGYTLQAGAVTSTGRKWAAYWITGGSVDGGGTPHVTGRTLLGPATAAVALTAQEAVCTPPASPPSTAIGWGLCATQAGASVFYVVAEAFTSSAGVWPSITDNVADASLTTPAPSSNTTGSPATFGAGATIPSSQTLAMAGATVSGAPYFNDGLQTGAVSTLLNARGPGSSTSTMTALVWEASAGGTQRATAFLDNAGGTLDDLVMGVWDGGATWYETVRQKQGGGVVLGASGGTVSTKNNTLDDGSGNATVANVLNIHDSAHFQMWFDGANERIEAAVGQLIFQYLNSAVPVVFESPVYFNKQIASSVPTGTAPLTVASTTPVTNLVPDATASAPTFAEAMHAEDPRSDGTQGLGAQAQVTTGNTAPTNVANYTATWSVPQRYVRVTFIVSNNTVNIQGSAYNVVLGQTGPTHSANGTAGATYTDVFDSGTGDGVTSATVAAWLWCPEGQTSEYTLQNVNGGYRMALAKGAA